MPTGENCGNEYDKTFDAIMDGKTHTCDCVECAIMKLAPTCAQCQTRIIGHSVEGDGHVFCGAHCAKRAGGLPEKMPAR